MSQGFKISFDQAVKSIRPSEGNGENSMLKNELYAEEGFAKNVCFIKEDGSGIFFSYSHLLTGEYLPNTPCISLVFSTHIVLLKGINLPVLFSQFMHHLVKQVVQTDARYNQLEDEKQAIVNEIVVTEKE